jgi:hypothetical protein
MSEKRERLDAFLISTTMLLTIACDAILDMGSEP